MSRDTVRNRSRDPLGLVSHSTRTQNLTRRRRGVSCLNGSVPYCARLFFRARCRKEQLRQCKTRQRTYTGQLQRMCTENKEADATKVCRLHHLCTVVAGAAIDFAMPPHVQTWHRCWCHTQQKQCTYGKATTVQVRARTAFHRGECVVDSHDFLCKTRKKKGQLPMKGTHPTAIMTKRGAYPNANVTIESGQTPTSPVATSPPRT